MRVSIRPLSELPPSWLTRYLAAKGVPPEVAECKSFDAAFNRKATRGHAWIRGDRVGSFLGVIPFTLAAGDLNSDAQRICNWSLDDPGATPGIGDLLIRTAMAATLQLLGLGANAAPRRLLSRMATLENLYGPTELTIACCFAHRWETPERRARIMAYVNNLARWPHEERLECLTLSELARRLLVGGARVPGASLEAQT